MDIDTRSTPRRRWTRQVAAAWIAAIVLVWLVWLVNFPTAVRGVRTAHVMCAGFPDFSRLVGTLPVGEPVPFVSDRESFQDASQALFCAQFVLAPLPLHFRTREEILAAAVLPQTLLVDQGDTAESRNFLTVLRQRARALGVELETRRGPDGAWIVRKNPG